MKSVFDKDFKYRPSFDTDVKKTIERARKRIEALRKRDDDNERERDQKLQKLETRRKA